MHDVNRIKFESFNSSRNIPPRSYLYYLEPIGVDTPEVESLTSYMSRLSIAHCLTPSVLFTYEIVPLMNRSYLLPRDKKPHSSLRLLANSVQALNGMGEIAKDCVKALETLTLRPELRYLTMLPWRDVLSEMHLLRRIRAWCPACFDERKKIGGIIYEPLLWTLKVVTVCQHHRRPLESSCPHCQCQSPLISSKSQPGHCPRCGESLGLHRSAITSIRASNNEQLQNHFEITKTIGEMLADSQKILSLLSKKDLAKNLSWYIDLVSKGNVAAFARHVKVDKLSMHSLRAAQIRPSLEMLVKICQPLGISIPELLNGKRVDAILPKDNEKLFRKKREVEALLRAALKDPARPSVTELAKQFGYSMRSTLHNISPELCKRITSRYKLAKKTRSSTTRKHANLRTIKVTLEIALSENPPPSLRRLTLSLGYTQSPALESKFPDLCRAIAKRRVEFLRVEFNKMEDALRAALKEDPPPTLRAVYLRLGYKSYCALNNRFPDLCRAIAARHVAAKDVTNNPEALLKAILKESPPPSMREVARRVGYDVSTLYKRFRKLCHSIAARHHKHEIQQAVERRSRSRQRIREVAISLHKRGIYPSRAAVGQEAKKAIRGGERAVLQEVQYELGLVGYVNKR